MIDNYLNKKNCMNGLDLLDLRQDEYIQTCFFDPQYRGVLDKLDYGNEGERQKERSKLKQMDELTIIQFLQKISKILKPSGHLFLWVDKFHLCEGSHLEWFKYVNLNPQKPIMNCVDMITWDKQSFGMGYRSRRTSEHLLIYQKSPKTIKNWTVKNIRDVWSEKIENPRTGHPHRKPVGLIEQLILTTTNEKDIVLDPCAGSFEVLEVNLSLNRNFLGCDLNMEFCHD